MNQRGFQCGLKGEHANALPLPLETPLMRLTIATLRRVVKGDLTIQFVPQALTSYGGLELLRRYLQRADVPGRLGRTLAALGSDYGSALLSLLVLALLYVGGRRPEHRGGRNAADGDDHRQADQSQQRQVPELRLLGK